MSNDTTPTVTKSADSTEINESSSIDTILKQLKNSASTKKQEQVLDKLLKSEKLFAKYIKNSPECQEIFTQLDETVEALNALKKSSATLNINETNTDFLLAFLEKAINQYKLNLKANDDKLDSNEKSDLKANINNICSTLLNNYINLITKCILMKSSTKKTVELQETCVRLLTLCVNHSAAFAKQIALEYDYFNTFKNWLERYLLLKQTYLRELSIEFLISFLKYAKVTASTNSTGPTATEETGQTHEDRETLFLIKKIFLNNTNSAENNEGGSHAKTEHQKSTGNKASTHSSLLFCLFSNVNTDTRESIEFLLQELLFRFVQNESFNKSEKIKLFNEKTLMSLIKLYEWVDPATVKTAGNEVVTSESQSKKKESKENSSGEHSDQSLIVHEMITEFLKILFCSTRFGINFYDRSLNIDQSTKNYNHLIFSVIINIQRPSTTATVNKATSNGKANTAALNGHLAKKNEACSKTNDMIDELLLKTLKVCPDLIQRFLKVKYKKVNKMNFYFSCGSLLKNHVNTLL